ncbi:MAG TPA: ABC transporter ATP-binding protein [Thermoflexales bacterium]|nr:ABC transporter ATP-binding protein [Thermoflexales bacterium]HQW34793.1 ABC transporter ATP-binding protein [Thermoflexales bacterium]HQX74927.1 ABC transporter ATP-binding protein [Thermoflexales bacterium]HQZ22678.1 ABC transporter ATP-binding protein [Thermoflexales bacterium]HRA00279.1 ABC transporter ATP-binding protein [Thermoflexales bacterium]
MNAIEFANVSKRFRMERDRPRSFQQAFVSLVQRRQNAENDVFWALRDVSFNVKHGQSIGLIGSNGSGKSTSLKIIAKIIQPTSGVVRVNGRVTALLELGAGFHPELSGRDNVFLNGAMMGLSREDITRRLDSIVHFAELEEFIDVPVKHYSSGMYVRLGFSVSVHLEPEILLVDEVLAVGDASFQHKCMGRIADLRRKGVTIVLVTHDLGAVQNLCEEAVWFDKSEMRAIGKPTDVVMTYLHDVARTDEEKNVPEQKLPELADGKRWGTGRVQITKVELRDAFDAQRTVFLTGSSMRVRIHYHAAQRVNTPVFGLAVHHANGAHVTGPNSKFDGLYIPFVQGDGVIDYTIPALPLLEGHYLLSVAAVDEAGSATYDYHDRAYTFDVMPGKTNERYGLVTFGGSWKLEEEQGQLSTQYEH